MKNSEICKQDKDDNIFFACMLIASVLGVIGSILYFNFTNVAISMSILKFVNGSLLLSGIICLLAGVLLIIRYRSISKILKNLDGVFIFVYLILGLLNVMCFSVWLLDICAKCVRLSQSLPSSSQQHVITVFLALLSFFASFFSSFVFLGSAVTCITTMRDGLRKYNRKTDMKRKQK